MYKDAATLLNGGEESLRTGAAGNGHVAISSSLTEFDLNYPLLFSRHPNPMYIFDRQTLEFLEVNAASVKKYGYSREEFLRMKVSDIRPTGDLPRLQEAVRQKSVDGFVAGRMEAPAERRRKFRRRDHVADR